MIIRLVDIDIFPWLDEDRGPTKQEVYRAATIVADRLCGANADPIVRNAQEKRQLSKIKKWLADHGYNDMSGKVTLDKMKAGMFAFRLNVPGLKEDHGSVNIPVDAAVMPLRPRGGKFPLMIEENLPVILPTSTSVEKRKLQKLGNFEESTAIVFDTSFSYAATSIAVISATKPPKELIGFGNIA
jgi:hypothetical protein